MKDTQKRACKHNEMNENQELVLQIELHYPSIQSDDNISILEGSRCNVWLFSNVRFRVAHAPINSYRQNVMELHEFSPRIPIKIENSSRRFSHFKCVPHDSFWNILLEK